MNCRTITSLIIALFLAIVPALAAPRSVSLQPHENKLPTPLLERGSPGQGNAQGLLGSCLLRLALGDLAMAEQACGEAIALDPQRADAFKLRGYVYLLERRYERANADFLAGMRLKPSDDQIVGGYAQSFSDMGRYPDAVAQFQKALTLAPQKAEYWNGLCWSRAGAGKGLKEALVACNKALRLEPRAAAAFNSRGLVHLRMRRFPEAIADYNRALQLSPDQPSARFGLGLAKLSMGNTAGALNISQARLSDPDIDRQFVDMGVLPEHCIGVGSKRCPRGFPSAQALRTNPVTARLREPMRQEIMRMASLFPR